MRMKGLCTKAVFSPVLKYFPTRSLMGKTTEDIKPGEDNRGYKSRFD